MMRKLLLSALPALALVAGVPADRASAQDNSADKIEEMKAKDKPSEAPAGAGDPAAKKEADKQVAPVQRKSPAKAKAAADAAKAKAAEPAKVSPNEGKASAGKPEDGEAASTDKAASAEASAKADGGEKAKAGNARKASNRSKAASEGEPVATAREPKADAAVSDTVGKSDGVERPKATALRKAAPSKTKAEVEPAGAPLANCEELKNDNGLRIIIYPPTAKSARIAIFDRSSNKELEKDLFSASQSGAAAYARVVWGTRNTPSERLLKGAFLISASEKDRFYEGMLMADGGDGSFLLHRAHLGKPDDDRKRWTLMLDAERSLSCRVGN